MTMRVASRVRRAGPVTVLAGVTALTVAGVATPASAAQAAAATRHRDPGVTREFRYTGHTASFFVPAGVRFVTVTAAGASGQGNHAAAGGMGAIVRSTIRVTPRSRLRVRVGGPGSRGGFNGGGHGPGRAGTGGGASTVSTSAGRWLAVAGGGGGAGARGTCLSAGGDGGNAGSAGSRGGQCTVFARGGRGGGAGLATLGGAGGAGGSGRTTNGTSGAHGIRGAGGAGRTTRGTRLGASGGGGGGYYGGGGGGSGGLRRRAAVTVVGAGGGGGGGSSLGHVTGLNFGPPSVKISYRVAVPVTITTSSTLPAGVVGRSYRATLAASGGRPPYSWSLFSGSLPPGLRLSRAGVISGRPAAAGVRFFTLRARDSLGRSATKRFRLTVVGRADLAIRLRHAGRFRNGARGRFGIAVTNTGSAPTSIWRPTEVALNLPRGLEVVQGGTGASWQCRKHLHSVLCVRRAVIRPRQTTGITVTVRVTARAGSVQRAQATVFPGDLTPADNTSTDFVVIYGR